MSWVKKVLSKVSPQNYNYHPTENCYYFLDISIQYAGEQGSTTIKQKSENTQPIQLKCCIGHTLIHTHTHTLIHSYTPTLTHSHTPTLIHSHTPTLTYSYTSTLTQSHIHTLTHSHTHTFIHSHTHTYTHIHTH